MPGVVLSDALYWIGLSLVVLAALCLAVTGARNNAWFGPKRSVLSELGPLDIKLAKIGGVLFITGALVSLIAFIVEIKGL